MLLFSPYIEGISIYGACEIQKYWYQDIPMNKKSMWSNTRETKHFLSYVSSTVPNKKFHFLILTNHVSFHFMCISKHVKYKYTAL